MLVNWTKKKMEFVPLIPGWDQIKDLWRKDNGTMLTQKRLDKGQVHLSLKDGLSVKCDEVLVWIDNYNFTIFPWIQMKNQTVIF